MLLRNNGTNSSKTIAKQTIATIYFENHPSNRVHKFSRMYDEEYVRRLHDFATSWGYNFTCISDTEFKGIDTRPFKLRDRNYWSVMELFAHDLGEVLSCGLDTVFVGDLSDLFSFSGHLGMLTDPNNDRKSCNGIMRFPHRPDIWDEYSKDPEKVQRQYGDEMAYIASFPHERLDTIYKGQVLSYKCHVLKGEDTSNARVVYFHGKPKPRDVGWLDEWPSIKLN